MTKKQIFLTDKELGLISDALLAHINRYLKAKEMGINLDDINLKIEKLRKLNIRICDKF